MKKWGKKYSEAINFIELKQYMNNHLLLVTYKILIYCVDRKSFIATTTCQI
jgi:hypothetical protein